MEKATTNTTALSKHSTTSPSPSTTLPAVVKTLNSPEGIKHFLATVPAKIEQVLDRPPVSELIRQGAKKESIEACLSVQITKAASMLTVGGNLREGQALEIAIQLIADFPNESLEDFCLCLKRGMKGIYGEIFRFDVLVINTWLKAYLEEKYQVAEDELMKQKDDYKNQFTWPADSSSDDEVKKRLAAWRAAVEATRMEVAEQKRDPVQRATGHKDPHPAEWYEMKDRIRRAASEFYRDRYSFSAMKVWTVKDQEVFAESQEDADLIYQEAMKK